MSHAPSREQSDSASNYGTNANEESPTFLKTFLKNFFTKDYFLSLIECSQAERRYIGSACRHCEWRTKI